MPSIVSRRKEQFPLHFSHSIHSYSCTENSRPDASTKLLQTFCEEEHPTLTQDQNQELASQKLKCFVNKILKNTQNIYLVVWMKKISCDSHRKKEGKI